MTRGITKKYSGINGKVSPNPDRPHGGKRGQRDMIARAATSHAKDAIYQQSEVEGDPESNLRL